MPDTPSEVTHLLRKWSGGSPEALDKLMPLVIDEVRDLARRALAFESPAHTPHRPVPTSSSDDSSSGFILVSSTA